MSTKQAQLQSRLERLLGCTIGNIRLYEQALTHRSAARANLERLEFLGDALLGLFAAELLFERFPEASESELSRMRAAWVRESGLAEIARELDLGNFLILGDSERKSGGWRRDSILADALEALIGAVYLDRGYGGARDLVRGWLNSRIDRLDAQQKDPKTRLQEWLQARRLPLPSYELLETQGADHEKVFTVGLSIPAMNLTTRGAGNSRRSAEQVAASAMLDALGSHS